MTVDELTADKRWPKYPYECLDHRGHEGPCQFDWNCGPACACVLPGGSDNRDDDKAIAWFKQELVGLGVKPLYRRKLDKNSYIMKLCSQMRKAILDKEEENMSRMRTIKASELDTVKMVAGNEGKISRVVWGPWLMNWVGIGWVNERPATAADKKRYPKVIENE